MSDKLVMMYIAFNGLNNFKHNKDISHLQGYTSDYLLNANASRFVPNVKQSIKTLNVHSKVFTLTSSHVSTSKYSMGDPQNDQFPNASASVTIGNKTELYMGTHDRYNM